MRESSASLKLAYGIAFSGMYYLAHDRIARVFRLKPIKSHGEVFRLRHDTGIKIMNALKKCPSDMTQTDKYTITGLMPILGDSEGRG